MTAIDTYNTPPQYSEGVHAPPMQCSREQLWEVVQEAHDYLSAWVNDPAGGTHPTKGEIHFNAGSWGRSRKDKKVCYVCLAGLWYLQKRGILLKQEIKDTQVLPRIADFLDDLRHVDDTDVDYRIEQWLDISIPQDLAYNLIADTDDYWDEDNPHHILLFLDWLLEQHDRGGST